MNILLVVIKTKQMKYTWTKEDLKNILKTQIEFLKSSCYLYDEGRIEEFLRIALTLRVLLHDTKSSNSLLNQLDIKSKIQYLSTHDESLISDKWISSLTTFQTEGDVANTLTKKSKIIPRKTTITKEEKINFRNWWEMENVLIFKGINWTRRKLVLAASNKLGGAHIDPTPKKDLIIINQKTGLIITMINGIKFAPKREIDGDQFSATIRQIGYEFLKSINSFEHI